MDQQFDILVAVQVSTMSVKSTLTKPPEDYISFTPEEMKAQADSANSQIGSIIEINWCAYDIKRQIVIDEVQYFVKPLDFMGKLSEETMAKTNIRPENLFSAFSLYEVIQKFNDFLYLSFTRNNLSFCLVTYGDELLTRILPNESKESKIKLAYHFHQYFDIKTEFSKFSNNSNTVTLKNMLIFLGLKEVPADTVCQNDCKTLVRIINMLTRSNHIFNAPKIINSQYKVISDKEIIKPPLPAKIPAEKQAKYNNFIKFKAPEASRPPFQKFYLRLRGLPYSAREPEVMEFFRGIRLAADDIQFQYDGDGKFTGESFVRVHNDMDFKEAMSYNLSQMGNRYIEIFESNGAEFEKVRLSQFPDKREAITSMKMDPVILQQQQVQAPVQQVQSPMILTEDVGIVRMRGLPYSCTEEDISNFFKGLRIAKNGIKRAVVGGRPSGEAYVVFESRQDAVNALNLNMEKIGTRFIELFSSSGREFENYLMNNFMNNAPNYAKDQVPSLPFDKRKSTLMCFGLPFTVTREQIAEFFSGFHINEKEIVFLNNHAGRFSGNILVTFEDEMEAQRALKFKNLAYLGNRYIEIYEYQ